MATTPAVMTGKDPAIKLLGSRLRHVIIEMMEWVPVDSERVPPHMTIGGPLKMIPTFGSSGSSASNSGVTFSSLFLSAATEAFEKRGFAFFAPELAQASLRVRKVINLSLLLHGEAVLDPLFLHALQQ